jgi:hypothetical protein
MQERARWFVLAGLLLLGGVIAWRLTAGSYKADIKKICFAEKSSGVDATKDVKKVEAWAKDHLDTPEANAWMSELEKKGVADRGNGLRDESKRLGIDECPLTASYETLLLEGEYRQDIVGLCSLTQLPEIEASDDAERLHKVLDWIGVHAKSPRTKALGDKLAQTDPKTRPDVLREAVNGAAVYQCELVSTLLKPQTRQRKDEPVIELGSPQVNGDLTVDKIVAVFLKNRDAMRKCYDIGLAKNSELSGRVMLKVALAAGGKVNKAATEKGTTLGDADVIKCVLKTTTEMTFPPAQSPIATLLLPLEFIPKAPQPQAPAPDPH